MKHLLALAALLLPLYLFAQGFGSFSHDQPYLAADRGGTSSNTCSGNDPSSIAGLAYWWVSSDLVVSNTVTNWVDRVQGSVWTNGANSQRPTNSNEGVYFSGSSWLTNVGLAGEGGTPGQGMASFFIIKRTAMPGVFGAILCNKTTSSGYKFSEFGPYGAVDMVYDQASPLTLSYPIIKTNDWITLLYSSRTNSGRSQSYTNGVFAYDDLVVGMNNQATNILGAETSAGNARNFVGYIREIAIWTNTYLATNPAAMLNCYATNTYGYTP